MFPGIYQRGEMVDRDTIYETAQRRNGGRKKEVEICRFIFHGFRFTVFILCCYLVYAYAYSVCIVYNKFPEKNSGRSS